MSLIVPSQASPVAGDLGGGAGRCMQFLFERPDAFWIAPEAARGAAGAE
jgi:hypothetical protein